MNPNGVLVDFLPTAYCGWIIPNDTAYTYHLIAPCNAARLSARISGNANPGEGSASSEQRTFINTVGCFPRELEMIDIFADLIWWNMPGLAEIWLFTFAPYEKTAEAMAGIGLNCRLIPLCSYDGHAGTPLIAIQIRSRDELASVYRAKCLTGTECAIIALRKIAKRSFETFTLCDAADYFLFAKMVRGQNINAVFPNVANLSDHRLYSVKLDAWNHESGDPMFVVDNGDNDQLMKAFRSTAGKYNLSYIQTKLSEPAFIRFLQTGEIAAMR